MTLNVVHLFPLIPSVWVCMCACLLTYVAEQHGQEDESVRGPQQHHGQVHAEVEDLEDLRLGQRQDEDASELSQRDPAEHLPPRHIRERYAERTQH